MSRDSTGCYLTFSLGILLILSGCCFAQQDPTVEMDEFTSTKACPEHQVDYVETEVRLGMTGVNKSVWARSVSINRIPPEEIVRTKYDPCDNTTSYLDMHCVSKTGEDYVFHYRAKADEKYSGGIFRAMMITTSTIDIVQSTTNRRYPVVKGTPVQTLFIGGETKEWRNKDEIEVSNKNMSQGLDVSYNVSGISGTSTHALVILDASQKEVAKTDSAFSLQHTMPATTKTFSVKYQADGCEHITKVTVKETTPLPPTHEFKTAPFYFTTPRYTRTTPQPSPNRPFYFTTPRYTRNTPTHTPSTPNATVNASTTPSPIHHDFTCDVTSMSVHFPVSLLPNSKLTLRDTDCVLNKTDTKYVLAFQFDDCGSSITYFHNKIVVENEINVHKDFGWSPFPIEFDADFKIPISCSIKRTVVIGGEIETVTHDSIVEEPDSNKVVRYTLKEFKTEEYKQEITAFPVKIPINREVFLELSSNASSPSLGIQIDECIATPSVNPKDPVAYPLIKNDCPVSPAAHVVTSTSAVKRRFKIQAFHFSGRVNNHNRVYFHCQVTYCLPYSCPMPTCSRSKRETRISRSRRVRRGVVRGQRRREIRPGSYISLGPFKIE